MSQIGTLAGWLRKSWPVGGRMALAVAVVSAALGLGGAVAQPASGLEPGNAAIDPPGRVGRIADLQGLVSWYDLEEGRWADAQRNRPITAGDRVATGREARARLRIGSTTVELGEGTEVELLRLDDERVRVQLHRGTLALRLRSAAVADETDFGTAEAWLQPRRGGLYRLERQDETTWASVWRGELAVDGEPGLVVDAGRRLQLWREGRDRQLRHRFGALNDDAFAAHVLRDDRDEERSASAAHVSPEMTGFEDLDRHGRWDRHPDHGAVWVPVSVTEDWVPFRDGRWVWVRPWGWTWIDDAPWGFAPFHYGRWAHWRGRWVWVPGHYVARPVYAPALVAWIDGPGVGIGIRWGGPTLSWLPLAPWEVYRPHYRVSPGYHERINPPDQRRWRPPPRGDADRDAPGHQGVPGAVSTIGRDRVPPPRPPRPGFDDARPPRPGFDDARPPAVRTGTVAPPLTPPPPPLPSMPMQPLPSRVQPPGPVLTPPLPAPRHAEPLPQRPPAFEDRTGRVATPAAPQPPALPPAALTPPPPRVPAAVLQPATPPQPALPPPALRSEPPAAKPQTPPPPRVPAAADAKAREREKERERERDRDREDPRGNRNTVPR